MNEPQIPVKYIFRRPRWVDNVYGSRLAFVNEEGAAQGLDGAQTRLVPESLALKLLRHTDTFVRDDAPEAAAPVKTTEQDTQETLDAAALAKKDKDARDEQSFEAHLLIDQMDKETLTQYVRERFALSLEETADIDAMRVEAKALIDRFGLV